MQLFARLRGLVRPRRQIFAFAYQGGRQYRDPVVIRRKLNEMSPEWGRLVDLVVASSRPLPERLRASPESVQRRAERAEDAAAELAGFVSAAFDVPPVGPDGVGMTESERIELLASYLEFCAALMRDHRPLPSALPATDSAGSA